MQGDVGRFSGPAFVDSGAGLVQLRTCSELGSVASFDIFSDEDRFISFLQSHSAKYKNRFCPALDCESYLGR